jgi:hypothetical protein
MIPPFIHRCTLYLLWDFVDIMKYEFSERASRDIEATGETAAWRKQYGYLIWP